jgi:hypothetical protein
LLIKLAEDCAESNQSKNPSAPETVIGDFSERVDLGKGNAMNLESSQYLMQEILEF